MNTNTYQAAIGYQATQNDRLWRWAEPRFSNLRTLINTGDLDAIPRDEIPELLTAVRNAVCHAARMDNATERGTVLSICYAIWVALPGTESVFRLAAGGTSAENHASIIRVLGEKESYRGILEMTA